LLSEHDDAHEEQGNNRNRNRHDPSLQSVLFPISTREDNGLSGLGISSSHWDVVDDVVDYAGATGDVHNLDSVSVTSDPMSQKSQ
jgi:hypothetical protein